MASDGRLYDWEISPDLRSTYETRRELMASKSRMAARAAAESSRLETLRCRAQAKRRRELSKLACLAIASLSAAWIVVYWVLGG